MAGAYSFIPAWVKVLAGLYITFVAGLFAAQRVFVFTGPYVISLKDRERDYQEWKGIQRVYEPEPGVELYSWFLKKPGKGGRTVLMFFGGNGRDVTDNIKALSQMGNHSVLAYNYRGYGKSTGSPTEKDLVSDALMILDNTLKENKLKPSDVIIIGESLGSGVATQVAAARDVKKLVLLVPFDSLLDVAKNRLPFVPVSLILKDTFRSDKHAPNVKCPVYIFAAENDNIIPPHHARRLSGLFPNLQLYKEYRGVGHHNLFRAKDSYYDYMKACRP